MPVTRLSQIQRFADCPARTCRAQVVDRLNAVGDDDAAVRQVGIELATELSENLMAGGAPGLHFITMNRSLATARNLRQDPAVDESGLTSPARPRA